MAICDELSRFSGVTECSICPICNGTGKVSGNSMPYDEGSYVTITCTDCDGTGEWREELSRGELIDWAIDCINGHYNVGRAVNTTLKLKV